MNYYPHHIGDFNNATRHLSRTERSVYRDLIELCYDTEKPLPDDLEYISKRILADDENQIYAMQQVLNEYFILTENGYENERCNKIIKEYQRNAKNKSKAGKASAKARKSKKTKDKTPSTDVQQPFNTCSTGVRNQEPEPITKNQEPLKDKYLSKNLKVCMTDSFTLNDTNKKWINDTGMPNGMKYDLFIDFVDYWKIEGSKKTEIGWQQAFRRNPIVKKKITNYLHNQGSQNGNEENRKLSAAERASKQVRDFEEHLRQKQANNSEGVATDGDMLRPSLD